MRLEQPVTLCLDVLELLPDSFAIRNLLSLSFQEPLQASYIKRGLLQSELHRIHRLEYFADWDELRFGRFRYCGAERDIELLG
jgi:hypothetical protein